MKGTDKTGATLRLWLLLTAAFLLSSAAGGIVMLQLTMGRNLADAKREVRTTAQSLSLRLSGLNQGGAAEALEACRNQIPNLERAELIPVTNGDLPTRYTESPLFREAMRRGGVAVSNVAVGEPAVFIAVTPVGTPQAPVGYLLLEIRAQDLLEESEHLRAVGALGLFLSVALGSLFAYAIARHVLQGPSQARMRRLLRRPRYIRTTLFEFSLAGIAGIIFVSGMVGTLSLLSLQSQHVDATVRLRSLQTIRKGLVESNEDPSTFGHALVLARTLGINGTTAAQIGPRVESELRSAQNREIAIFDQQQNQVRALTIAMTLSALLTLTALVLLRATAAREHDLDEAEHSVARSELARRQIAESLPVGFYTFGPDQIQYCNDAWCSLVQQAEGEESTDALRRALHPDERDAVLAALRDAVQTGSGFGFGHRLITREGEVRHVESRGVPILDESGAVEHVVGFTMDVSTRVRTRQLLESKTREVEATNARLRQALADQEENLEEMVLALVKAVEAKDPYTAGHSERVMQYSVRIGEALGLSPQELRVLRMGTLIHDVGKIGIPDDILTKPASLTTAEFNTIKLHPEVGARMVEGIPLFRDCVPIVLLHHERLDGTGYPYGLKANELPICVRISAVADCFDAMTSTRAYRNAMDPEVAIERLQNDASSGKLDERIVRELADIVRREGLLPNEARPRAA